MHQRTKWRLHEALERGDATDGRIDKPELEYSAFHNERVAFVLETTPSDTEENSALVPSTTHFTPYALIEPQQQPESMHALKRRSVSQTDPSYVVIIEINSHVLGQGTFGACYKATVKDFYTRDEQLAVPEKEIALKQLNMEEDPERLEKYKHESDILKKLGQHDSIVKYLFAMDCICRPKSEGEDDSGTTYFYAGIAMELCSGTTLHHALKCQMKKNQEGQPKQLIPLEELIDIFRQSADGLRYMEENKIIHCDIKLDNVMWDDRKRILKFIDFGLAYDKNSENRYTHGGTLCYMAPECSDGKIDFYSDVWSLGIMMSCLILQTLPYGTNPAMIELNKKHERWKRGEHSPNEKPLNIKEEREKIYRKEISDLKRRQLNMTTVEQKLRNSYNEVDEFCLDYQPRNVVENDAFKSLASQVACTLYLDGIDRPKPQALVEDCKNWLEELKQQKESMPTPEKPQRETNEFPVKADKRKNDSHFKRPIDKTTFHSLPTSQQQASNIPSKENVSSGSKGGVPSLSLLKQSTNILQTEELNDREVSVVDDELQVVREAPDEGDEEVSPPGPIGASSAVSEQAANSDLMQITSSEEAKPDADESDSEPPAKRLAFTETPEQKNG